MQTLKKFSASVAMTLAMVAVIAAMADGVYSMFASESLKGLPRCKLTR